MAGRRVPDHHRQLLAGLKSLLQQMPDIDGDLVVAVVGSEPLDDSDKINTRVMFAIPNPIDAMLARAETACKGCGCKGCRVLLNQMFVARAALQNLSSRNG